MHINTQMKYNALITGKMWVAKIERSEIASRILSLLISLCTPSMGMNL
jgi:hypothetical protein